MKDPKFGGCLLWLEEGFKLESKGEMGYECFNKETFLSKVVRRGQDPPHYLIWQLFTAHDIFANAQKHIVAAKRTTVTDPT